MRQGHVEFRGYPTHFVEARAWREWRWRGRRRGGECLLVRERREGGREGGTEGVTGVGVGPVARLGRRDMSTQAGRQGGRQGGREGGGREGGREGGRTRDIGEVVVLVVIPHVKGKPVEGTIVGVGLLPGLIDEMLGNKMAGHGVYAHA